MKLPSFNKRQFTRHIRKGPGFGCWGQKRINRAWGKKPRRVTAKDMAQRILRTYTEEIMQTYIMLSMLNKEAMISVFNQLGITPPFNLDRASRWAYRATGWKHPNEIARAVLEL